MIKIMWAHRHRVMRIILAWQTLRNVMNVMNVGECDKCPAKLAKLITIE
jgi:hypothetical protein